MKKSRLLGAVCACLYLYSINGYTDTVTYDISWTGSNGYSMTGDFSFDDSLLGELIVASDVSSLSIEGFLSGSSVGNFTGSPTTLNFDSGTGLFVAGPPVDCSGSGGQAWGMGFCGGTGFGFAQGSDLEGLYLNGSLTGSIEVSQTTLFATAQTPVPVPAAAWLFGSALLGLGVIKRRKA